MDLTTSTPKENGFAAQSLAMAQIAGAGLLASSLEAGWSSVLVARRRFPREAEEVVTIPTPDHMLGLVSRGTTEFVMQGSRCTKKGVKRTGLVMTTAPGRSYRMSWRTLSAEPYEVVSLFLPQRYFDEAAEEMRRAGAETASSEGCEAAPEDGAVAQVLLSLATAAEQGMPDSYADSAARFLATHLLATQHGSVREAAERSAAASAGEMTDRRLARVVEFLEERHREDVSNEEMARVAGISPFHFARLFKRRMGVTPHRYVQRLRMRTAREMLRGTDLSVLEVASACGYTNGSHFAAAFCAAFGKNPGEFRSSLG